MCSFATGASTTASPAPTSRLRAWLLEGLPDRGKQQPGAEPAHEGRPWWRVMCLTGLDYFSTLGYQPGIAALAAGLLSPVATIVLVLLTLFGALPVYRRVAEESPHGEGSIAMLERLLTFWKGKLFVLTLLGFAATDFLITITLSAADATAHMVENPHLTSTLHGHEVLITLILIALLGAVFLKGFGEAIGVAVVLVTSYLALNAVVVTVCLWEVITEPHVVTDWSQALTAERGSPFMMIAIALIVFPKLALGLSGFETGVAVMPHVRGEHGDTEQNPAGRIRGTKKLLTTAAIVMSVFLICSSFITTLLIPADEFKPGGEANGRALAYIAHENLGTAFGTVYDISTILILWFAGSSAMAGLLNLMPRYLPRYGMAPHWARAVRPMVIVFTLVAFLVTWIFKADVDAQGGAYATGVLVLITSAAVAVTIAARRARERGWTLGFGLIATVFIYSTAVNVVERPDGVKIGACFIAGIMGLSLLSRLARVFELRVTDVELDDTARRFIRDTANRTIRFVANEPDSRDATEYRDKAEQIRADNDIPAEDDVLFVEVTVLDPSEFESGLRVRGEVLHGRYRVLTLLFGQGEVAPVTREVIRGAEPDRARRPHVHAG
ncbi:amino acid transporter [Streptomyces rubiginosohelvolus]|uniref:amino acid transporter n=1 Tax=Streptomyces rubiginosohelvolus TaxID=67362 RepID=UPI0036AB9997